MHEPDTHGPDPKASWFSSRLLCPLGLLALSCILGLPEIVVPPGLDQGILAYVGSDILDGGVPYLTTWDHKPPGSHYLFSLAFLVLGESAEAIRLFDLIAFFFIALVTFKLGERLFNRLTGFVSAALLLIAYYSRLSWWDKCQPDEYMLLPMLLGLLLVLGNLDRRRQWVNLLAGVCLGYAFITKFVALVSLVPILLLHARRWQADRKTGRSLLDLGVLLGGFVLVNGALLLYFLGTGALENFIESQVTFNRGYVLEAFRGHALGIFQFITWFKAYLLVGLAALGMLVMFLPGPFLKRLRLQTGLRRFHCLFVVVLLGVIIGEVIAQAKFYPYHFIPLLPPLCLLAGVALFFVHAGVAAWLPAPPRIKEAAAGLVVAVLTVATLAPFTGVEVGKVRTAFRFLDGSIDRRAYYLNFGGYANRKGFSYLACRETAQYIRAHTAKDDLIYIWSFDPLLHFLAERKMPTRYTYNTPLIVPWGKESWRDEFMGELEANPPVYFLFLDHDQHPWTTGRRRDSYSVMMTDFPRLEQFVRRNYTFETQIEDYHLLRKNK